jgi:hypothetical protein
MNQSPLILSDQTPRKHVLNNERLHVIAVISNPIRYNARYELFKRFTQYVSQFKNVEVHTVEIAFGDRQFYATGPETLEHTQLQSFDELWHKENMINLGMKNLPDDWQYVAWIDTDVRFTRNDWVEETLHQLQHYMFVQMFEDAVDLGPREQFLKRHKGFMHQYLNNPDFDPSPNYYSGASGHPGFAWAARREAIDHVGGIIDIGILGSGDRHMACGLVGQMSKSYSGGLHPAYGEELAAWEARAERHISRDVGFVPGTLLHEWHGKKVDRQYGSRWKILVDHQFNPRTDIKRDWQGLWQLEVTDSRQRNLRDAIRRYFRARHEDSIDLG